MLNKKQRYIVIEGMYGDTAIIAFIAAIALKFKKKAQKIICVQLPNSANFDDELRNKDITIFRWKTVILGFFRSFYLIPYLFYILLFNKFERVYLLFKNEKIDCSNEFKDTVSVKYGIFWQQKNVFSLFVLVYYELLFFRSIVFFFKRNHDSIDLIVIGDTAYRYGYFSKMSSLFSIAIICNLDLNSIYMNYYPDGYKFGVNRPISSFPINEIIIKYPDFKKQINNYFNQRTNGKIIQHDVLLAYNVENRNDISDLVNKGGNKIIVSVFAHIFNDAPRNIPGLLFEDFYCWFIETINSLSKNPNVFILIKEHPSVSLYYGEKGLVKKILDLQFPFFKNYIIVENYIPTDIILISDFVITGSGTIGLEATYFQKNVIIAAKTPYSDFGLTQEFNSKEEYCKYLENLSLTDLTEIDLEKAELITFIYFFLLNNRDLYVDFPLKPYVRGENFNISNEIFDNLISYVSKDTLFSNDIDNMIKQKTPFFVPKI